jgi:hypothetical protein
MPDPNAAIGAPYAFTWRGFTARVPKHDYDEVRRFLRRRSRRDRLKVGVVSMVRAEAAFDAVRNGTAFQEQHDELVLDIALIHASGLAGQGSEPSGSADTYAEPATHGSADDPDTCH